MRILLLSVLGQSAAEFVYTPDLSPLEDANCTKMPIWPYPAHATFGTETSHIGATTFAFQSVQQLPTLTAAFERYQSSMFPFSEEKHSAEPQLLNVLVHVSDPSELHLQVETDESYSLHIPTAGTIRINSTSVYGALRGLETLSQLITFEYSTGSYVIQNSPWEIQDSPRFPHRGLMIDTARHFLPLSAIRKVIDSLVYSKLNVLHWHMTDDNSFPMQSRSHEKLWLGAFSSSERYRLKDIELIVEYARLRGVRVIVEFDMPGHNRSWCKGVPEICPAANCTSPLDVSSNRTFQVISDVLHEMTGGGARKGLFPDDFIHLGGDEVRVDCWNSVPHIAAWLRSRNFTADDAYMYFVNRAAEIAVSQGRRPIQWVEVFDHFGSKLNKQVVVHVWLDKGTLQKVVQAGYSAILSNNKVLYLDHRKITWEMFYQDELHEGIDDLKHQKLVLGGQSEMWGETVDGSDIEATIWPRAAAFAERLWSPRAIASTTCALPRLQQFRCLLLSRGVAAAPVTNPMARTAPSKPGSCFV